MSASKSYKKGVLAEYLAILYLMLKGYKTLKHRYKIKVGEIDIVLFKSGAVVFVEVKTRKSQRDALESITSKNRARVMRAAEDFIQKHPQYGHCEMRFDVVTWSSYVRLSHLKQAWIS